MREGARLVGAAALLLLGVAGCTTAPNRPRSDAAGPVDEPSSGIRGTVTIGPTCPVVRQGEDCADKPYATTLLLQDSNGRVVESIVVPASGLFSVSAPAGSYVIAPAPSAGLPYAAPQPVVVRENTYTDVRVTFDSGIR